MAQFRLLLETLLFCSLVLGTPLAPRDTLNPNFFSQFTPSKHLTWTPCISANFFCAVLNVPLAYTNISGPHAYVPLLRYAATTTPYQGMLLVNPGGPGVSAIDFLIEVGGNPVGPLVASNYDFVAWEPRGVGYSTPLANCSRVPTAVADRVKRGSRFKLYGPEFPEEFFEEQYQIYEDLGRKCQATIAGPSQAGPYMTTTTTAKDMLTIVDAYASSPYSSGVPKASQVNYWGFSYGTIIGQTFASIYPSRVGRFVLDGVNDPDDYVSGLGLKDLQDTDGAFSTFFIYCYLAGPALCPYFIGSSSHDIYLRFEKTINKLDASTAIADNWANASAIAYTLEATKQLAVAFTRSPISGFPELAEVLLFLESVVSNISFQDLAPLEALVGPNITLTAVGALPEWAVGIFCSDTGNALYGKSVMELLPLRRRLEKMSFIAGELAAVTVAQCAGWGIRGANRFAGPFGANDGSSILFVSNLRDPITPYINGQKGTVIFKHSQLLTIDATGHTSLAAQNLCAFKKINQWFQTGKLSDGSFCSLEAGPWNVTISSAEQKRELRAGMRLVDLI